MDNCIHGTDVRNPCGICSSAYSAEEEAIELANGMLNQSAVKRIAKAILDAEDRGAARMRERAAQVAERGGKGWDRAAEASAVDRLVAEYGSRAAVCAGLAKLIRALPTGPTK
jgi:hypothetical protein